MRSRAALALAFAFGCVIAPQRAWSTDDAAAGYGALRPSLVKVWAFDSAGRPIDSGSGVVVASSGKRSYILTAEHVIAKAAALRIDVDRRLHDVIAHVAGEGPRDLALLSVDRGGFVPATFAPRDRAIVEGNVVAVAGYVKHDELIGIVGQEPRLLYPGTISSRPDDGKYLELENVHIEEGLSGGPVFDPQTGDVLGIVTARTTDERGGFADSGPLVVLAFLDAQRVAVATTHVRLAPPKAAVANATPAAPARIASVARASPAPAPVVVARVAAPTYWRVADAPPKAFSYEERSCSVVVSVQISSLNLALSAHGLAAAAPSRPGLALLIRRSTTAYDACGAYRDSAAVEGDYEPVASAYDGHHLTVRYTFSGARDAGAATSSGDVPFPSDISLDVAFGTDPVVATVQFFDENWSGALEVDLLRADAGALSVAPPY